MAKETKYTTVVNINIDPALTGTISKFRFKNEISSENLAYRELLSTALDKVEASMEEGPASLIAKARELLKHAQPEAEASLTEALTPENLPSGKRLNLDPELAARIATYKERSGLDSTNQAIGLLLWYGLVFARGRQPGAVREARFYLKTAYLMQLAAAKQRARVMEDAQEPEAILAAAAELFENDGALRGLEK